MRRPGPGPASTPQPDQQPACPRIDPTRCACRACYAHLPGQAAPHRANGEHAARLQLAGGCAGGAGALHVRIAGLCNAEGRRGWRVPDIWLAPPRETHGGYVWRLKA